MALETATFINALASSNPPAGDPVSQAADHIRLIKSVLLSTFPNLSGAMTLTAPNLNLGVCPTGMITPWYSTAASVPAGWGVCDGSTYAKSDGSGNITTPNIVNRTVFGSGDIYGRGGYGGSTTHNHGLAVDSHALSWNEMPVHNHGVNDPGHNHGLHDPGHAHGGGMGLYLGASAGTTANVPIGVSTGNSGTGMWIDSSGTGVSTQNSGSGWGHNHTGNSDWQAHMPPFVALVWMMKL